MTSLLLVLQVQKQLFARSQSFLLPLKNLDVLACPLFQRHL